MLPHKIILFTMFGYIPRWPSKTEYDLLSIHVPFMIALLFVVLWHIQPTITKIFVIFDKLLWFKQVYPIRVYNVILEFNYCHMGTLQGSHVDFIHEMYHWFPILISNVWRPPSICYSRPSRWTSIIPPSVPSSYGDLFIPKSYWCCLVFTSAH